MINRRFRWFSIVAVAAALAVTVPATAGATTTAVTPRLPAQTSATVTVPMTLPSASTSNVHTDGTSGQVPGTCGFSKLDTNASARQYDLTLYSTAGTIGAGSYTVATNGFASLEQPGVINGRDSTIWSSGWTSLVDPGSGPTTASLTGFVFVSQGVCGFSLSAPWN